MIIKNGSSNDTNNQLFFGAENSILRAFLPNRKNDQDTSQLSEKLNLAECFPLCLYGPSGTGKSEVASIVAQQLFGQFSLTRKSANDFFRDYLDAIDLDEMVSFRQSFSNNDTVFILDNFEEFASKPSIFDELVYLLDHSHRLIVTCSKNPADLPDIPYRITSRLLAGLSISVDVPSTIVRRQILQQEVTNYGSSISDDAAFWLVDNIAMSIPEIKKIVSRLRIHLDFRNPIAIDSVKKVFSKQAADIPPINEIAKIVSKNQLLKVSDLKSQSRKRSIVQARAIAVYIGREIFKYKYDELGRYFGNRDHSTIMHAHKKFKNEIKLDAELRKCVDEISSTIQQKRDT